MVTATWQSWISWWDVTQPIHSKPCWSIVTKLQPSVTKLYADISYDSFKSRILT
jgi:hypothetical protein